MKKYKIKVELSEAEATEVINGGVYCFSNEEIEDLKEKMDKRFCHLCGSEEIKKWCSNKSCAEYLSAERINN